MSLLYSHIGASRQDADAIAYVSAIRTAGATVTAAQRDYINDFIRAEKIAARWDSIKRLYMPIWGVAAANAICLRSLASGTFVGTVTHAAGYAQGNGSTGYLNTNTDFVTQGLTLSSGFMFALTILDATQDFDRFLGAGTGTSESSFIHRTSPRLDCRYSGVGSQILLNTSSNTGVATFSRISGTRRVSVRKTAGVTSASNTTADTGTIPSSNVLAMALNNANTGVTMANASDARFGAVGFGLGLTSASTDAFTLALKKLWEGTTGLTLP